MIQHEEDSSYFADELVGCKRKTQIQIQRKKRNVLQKGSKQRAELEFIAAEMIRKEATRAENTGPVRVLMKDGVALSLLSNLTPPPDPD